MSKQEIRQKLSEFLQQYYDGSFSRMACDYIHATGMKKEEVEALLEAMRDMTKCNEWLFFCTKYRKFADESKAADYEYIPQTNSIWNDEFRRCP